MLHVLHTKLDRRWKYASNDGAYMSQIHVSEICKFKQLTTAANIDSLGWSRSTSKGVSTGCDRERKNAHVEGTVVTTIY